MRNDKPTISLCMIVKDEGNSLEWCLDNVKDYVDEIIIVDTGSKDNTIKIAENFGAKIIEHEWKDDFSEARNVSLKYATKDWILVLDADEKISEKDFNKITSLLSNKEKSDAFYLIQRNYLIKGILSSADASSVDDDYEESRGYIGWSPSEVIRIFRNNKGFLFSNVIHESIKQSVLDKKGVIKHTDIPIHHFKERKKDSFKQDKTEKYFELCKKQIELTPDDPKAYYDLGLMYQSVENLENALDCFERAFDLMSSETLENEESQLKFASILISLAEILIKKGENEQAIVYLKRGHSMFPQSPIILSLLGRAYKESGDTQKSIEFYKRASSAKPDAEGIHHNLVDLYIKNGQPEKAVERAAAGAFDDHFPGDP